MSTSETTATEKQDVYRKVTDSIVNAIEQGVGNWRMPWHTSGRLAFSPINTISRKPYRGINTLCLWAAAESKGYESGEWGTYKQWQDRGAQVRKGEKSTTVLFWKFGNDVKESQDDGGEQSAGNSRLIFTRGYAVFNAAQVDGYTPKAEPETTMPERIERAEAFFRSVGADLRHGGNPAYYALDSDHIQMPPFQAFEENVAYYSTLAHEHTHWTAKPHRCDRQLGKRFGDCAYAAEELIAELGAAFTCSHLGLSTEPRADHAQYINSWLKVLKADKRAIFTAASKAQQAADWLASGRIIYNIPFVSQVRIFEPVANTDTQLAGPVQGLNSPQDMVLDPTATFVLVSNFLGNSITKTNIITGLTTTLISGFARPEGLAFDAAGNLYALGGGFGGVANLYQLNPSTGAILKTSAAFDPTNTLDGMVWDRFSNLLYATSQSGNALYSINPVTFAATKVATVPTPDGVISDTNGVLYISSRDFHVYRLNVLTNAVSQLTLVSGLLDIAITGLTAAPTPTSVSPNSGSGGGPQTFTAVVSDPSGATDLNVVDLDFATSAGAAHTCFVAYVRPANQLYLLDDSSTGLVAGSITPGTSTTLSNSQCTLSGAGGAVVASGTNLTVPFRITFAPGFTGSKNIYGLAQNNSGVSSAWANLGTWTTTTGNVTLGAVSVTPASGAGLGPQNFTTVFADPAGATDLNVVYLDFGTTPGAGSSCNAAYVRSVDSLYLLNDAGNGLVPGSVTPGGTGTLSNSQCTLSGAGGIAITSGNNVTVPFRISFNPGFFDGAKNIYGLAQNNAGANGGYQTVGTWTPETLILGGVAVSPNIGSGSGSQTFTAVFTDPNSFGDIHVIYLDVGTSAGAANACNAAYVRPTNQLFLLDDTSLGLVSGAITPGGAGTLSNSQCTLSGLGGPVTAIGNTLVVPINVTFAAGFAGAKNIYGLVLNNNNQNGGFQTLGTWTVTAPTLKAATVNPSGGSGFGPQTFSAVYTDPNTAGDIHVVYLDFATSPGSANSCFAAYVPSANQLYLLNDAATGLVSGSITPGGVGTLSNSQCTLSGAGGATTSAGNNLTVPFSVTFAGTFTGAKTIYGLVQNNSSVTGGWQSLGSWTP